MAAPPALATPTAGSERRAHHDADLAAADPSIDRRTRESICEALIDSGSLALATISDGVIAFASPGFLRLLGLPSGIEETATSWCRHIHVSDRARVAALVGEATITGRAVTTECRIAAPDGGTIPVHLAGYPAASGESAFYTLLLHVDVRQRPGAPGPRLPTTVRRAFARGRSELLDRAGDLLVDAWIKSESLAVLAVGLCPPAGGWNGLDQALVEQALCERLRPCLRGTDVLERNGDDGLLIAIPNLGGACSAGIVAGRLIEIASRPLTVDGTPVQLALNVGIALFPDDDQELSGLLTHAGAALELARQSGPNCYSLAETSLNLTLHPRVLRWDDGLTTGLGTIDAQHRQLVDDMRRILHDVGAHPDLALIQADARRLRQALVADFQAEGEIMDAHPGTKRDAHRADHERALRSVGFLDHADPRQSLALSTRFLYQWLPGHIREHDVPLVLSTYRPLW